MKIIKPEDILSLEQFDLVRDTKREEILALKKKRRVSISPFVTVYFENYDTMWWQIHEMLRIEKGGDAQIEDELVAYNPLIPQGNELIATLMIEINDPVERLKVLSRLGGVESCILMRFNTHTLKSHSIDNEIRTTDTGKTSSVHFLRWVFTPQQKEEFSKEEIDITLEINHQHYQSKTLLSSENHRSLLLDL